MPRDTTATAIASASASNHKESQNEKISHPKTQTGLKPLFADTNRALLLKPSRVLRAIHTGISAAALQYHDLDYTENVNGSFEKAMHEYSDPNFKENIQRAFAKAQHLEKHLTADNKEVSPADWFRLAQLYHAIGYKFITEKNIEMRCLGDMLHEGDPNKDEDTFYSEPISKYYTEAKRCLDQIASPQMTAEYTCCLIEIENVLFRYDWSRDDTDDLDEFAESIKTNFSQLEDLVISESTNDDNRMLALANLHYRAGKVCAETNNSKFFEEAESSLNTAIKLSTAIFQKHRSADAGYLLSQCLRCLVGIQLEYQINSLTKIVDQYYEALQLASNTYPDTCELYKNDICHLMADAYIHRRIYDASGDDIKTTNDTKAAFEKYVTTTATLLRLEPAILREKDGLENLEIKKWRATKKLDVAPAQPTAVNGSAKRKSSPNESEANKKPRVETATAVDTKQTAKPTFSWPKFTDAFTARKTTANTAATSTSTTSSTPQYKQ